jgi:hypothetical protein
MPQPWEQFQSASQAEKQPWEHFGAQPDDSGFIKDVGNSLTNRANELADNVVAYKSGDITGPEMALRFVGKAGAGTASDLASNAINAATPDVVRRGLASGAQATSDAVDSTYTGQAIGDQLLGLKDVYNNFARAHPRALANLESIGNLATVLPAGKTAAPAISDAAQNASNAVKGLEGLADRYATKYPVGTGPIDPLAMQVAQPITASTIKKASGNAYKDAEMLGGTLNPLFTSKALNLLEQAKRQPIAGKVLTSEDAAINNALGEYEGLRGVPLTLEDYQRLDSSLGDKATQAFVSGDANKGRVIAEAQDNIRDSLGKLAETDVMGGKEGFDVLTKDAIPLWSAQAKMQDIEKIINRANMMDNPSTGMRTGFRNLMLNPKRFSKYSPQVQKLIAKAASTGKADDLLGILGSRLNPIVAGAVGGLPGTAAAAVSSGIFRGIRGTLKNNQADKVVNALAENVRPSIEKYNFALTNSTPTLKEIMNMPPAQARAYLAKIKSAPAQTKR